MRGEKGHICHAQLNCCTVELEQPGKERVLCGNMEMGLNIPNSSVLMESLLVREAGPGPREGE